MVDFSKQSRKASAPGQDASQGISSTGFQDPSGEYPRKEYFYSSSINQAAVGTKINKLYLGGGDVVTGLDLYPLKPSDYPLNQVKETASGHVIEYDDTPGNERILIKHATGSGVELRADGSTIVSATNNKIEVTGGNQKVIVEGNGTLVYKGNLNLSVTGDLNIDCANFNLEVNGDKKVNIDGNYREEINGNVGSLVNGNVNRTSTKATTDVRLGDYTSVIKGDQNLVVSGDSKFNVGRTSKITAKDELDISSDNVNIGAQDISVFGATGTIGGTGIIYYAHNYYGQSATFTEGVTAPTFHGDLNGTAKEAIDANKAATAAIGTASPGGYTLTNTATDSTRSLSLTYSLGPTQDLMNFYLHKSDRGIGRVNLDPGDFIKNAIDRTSANDGVASKSLTTKQIRSKLRDPNTKAKDKFIANALAEGKLSPQYSRTTPPSVGRIVKAIGTARHKYDVPGNTSGSIPSDRFVSNKNRKAERLLPDPVFNPNFKSRIRSDTLLAPGIAIAKFLGGHGDRITLNHIRSHEEKIQIARNLYYHAQIIRRVATNKEEFEDYRMVVAEGVYKKGPNEILTKDSFNSLATVGRCVVYELYNEDGFLDVGKTFDLAVYLKDFVQFDRLVLDYDNYNPDGSINAQIIITVPNIPETFSVQFQNSVETFYNGELQSDKELIEVTLPILGT